MTAKAAKKGIQYSKKISTAVIAFWIFYRILTVCAAFWRAEVADALVKLAAGVDSVMMVNLGFYCGNSVSEKAILAWMSRKAEDGAEEEEEEEDGGEDSLG